MCLNPGNRDPVNPGNWDPVELGSNHRYQDPVAISPNPGCQDPVPIGPNPGNQGPGRHQDPGEIESDRIILVTRIRWKLNRILEQDPAEAQTNPGCQVAMAQR